MNFILFFLRGLFFLILLDVCVSEEQSTRQDYRRIFNNRYVRAIHLVEQNWNEWTQALEQYGAFPEELIPVVFPELIRYSALKCKIETTALKLFYINEGEQYADFSIGLFQMKPSFAERLEEEVLSWKHTSPQLYAKWLVIPISMPVPEGEDSDSKNNKHIRRERVRRLQEINWDCDFWPVSVTLFAIEVCWKGST